MPKIDLSKPLEIVQVATKVGESVDPIPVKIIYSNLNWVVAAVEGEEDPAPIVFNNFKRDFSKIAGKFTHYYLRNKEPSLEEKAEEVALGWYEEHLKLPIAEKEHHLPGINYSSITQGALYKVALKLLKEGTIK